jgi:cytochrome c-type biogenesis protein CcmF
VHSILVVERRGILKGWTITLIQATFLLTILGTFMTRSGVFNSVHSFTQSAIGPTILIFLAAALIFSVVLLTLRIDSLSAEGRLETGPSRDVAFLVQNLLFVLFTFTVLLGTVFPLVVEAVRGVQMSVGRPYFDKMSVPIGVALLFLMGVGPALPWGRANREQLKASLLPPVVSAAVLAILGVVLGVRNPWTLLALGFGGFTAQVTVSELLLPVRRGCAPAKGSRGVPPGRGAAAAPPGAYIVHAGPSRGDRGRGGLEHRWYRGPAPQRRDRDDRRVRSVRGPERVAELRELVLADGRRRTAASSGRCLAHEPVQSRREPDGSPPYTG